MSLSDEAREFTDLLVEFTAATDGAREAIAVSADGLLLASSAERDGVDVERFAAIVSGLTGLANGAAACVDYERVEQLVVEMSGGFLFVSAMGDGSVLGVLAERRSDVGQIGYEMTMLLNRAGRTLTPELVAELTNPVAA